MYTVRNLGGVYIVYTLRAVKGKRILCRICSLSAGHIPPVAGHPLRDLVFLFRLVQGLYNTIKLPLVLRVLHPYFEVIQRVMANQTTETQRI